MSNSGDGNGRAVHILAFPYPAPGHIIPMIDFTKLLLTRGISVTVLVTPRHLHLLEPLLKSHPSSAIETLVLSPPEVPPSCTTYNPLARINALAELYDPILQWFRSRSSPPVAILSDFLLGWTNRLTSDVGVPRLVFWPTGAASVSIFNWLLTVHDIHHDDESIVSVPAAPNSHKYPWWQLSQNLPNFQHGDPAWAFFRDSIMSNVQSWGAVMNSFDELERVYVDHLMKEMGHDRVWTVGPLMPPDDDQAAPSNRGGSSSMPVDEVMRWLNSKPDNSVVYVCFGSSWTITDQQAAALAGALESSGVNFIWVLKEGVVWLNSLNGFEERVERRGFIIKGWAPQVPILNHRAVGAFVSHCGWNSTLEALTAGVLMLTWPLAADQFVNARLLVDEHGVAVRFWDAGDRAVPDSAGLARLLGEWVGGARPVRLMELCRAASEALKAGGSSSKGLEMLVQQLRSLS